MNTLKIISTFLLLNSVAFAQTTVLKDIQATATKPIPTDTTSNTKWQKGGILNLSFTDVANSNWIAAGGDKYSLAFSGNLNVFANKRWNRTRTTWNNLFDASYGVVNTTTLGVRKVNDIMTLTSKLGYVPPKWKKSLSLTALGQFRSQFSDGYDYNYLNNNITKRVSGFFAPAYITLAPGVNWKPKTWFSLFVSPASPRWTIVSNDPLSLTSSQNQGTEMPLSELYGVNPHKEFLFQFGAFATLNIKKEILKNILYSSQLDLYTDYLKNPQNVSLFWTNHFFMKVNNWITVNYELDFIDDSNIRQDLQYTSTYTPPPVGLQVLSTLGVGISIEMKKHKTEVTK